MLLSTAVAGRDRQPGGLFFVPESIILLKGTAWAMALGARPAYVGE
jgi:hypothetical protein